MTQSSDLLPPTEPGEIETITFDFSDALAADESILLVTSVKCAVVLGSDVATGHMVGHSLIVNSPSSGRTDQAVIQQVGTMLGNNVYQYQCLVRTSGGQELQLRANMPCAAVPVGT